MTCFAKNLQYPRHFLLPALNEKKTKSAKEFMDKVVVLLTEFKVVQKVSN